MNGKQTSCSLPLLPATGVAGEAGVGRRREQVKQEDKQRQAKGETESDHLCWWLSGEAKFAWKIYDSKIETRKETFRTHPDKKMDRKIMTNLSVSLVGNYKGCTNMNEHRVQPTREKLKSGQKVGI